MDMHYTCKPEGVCPKELSFDIVNGIVHNVKFNGGCTGNARGVSLLVEGMPAEEVINRLRGVDCHNGFSCPDQLAQAIEKCLAAINKEGEESV